MYAQKNRGLFSVFNGMSATWQIIALNVIVFVASFILFLFYPSSIKYFAIVPANLAVGNYFWTLVLHMFSHAGFFHLAFNMFSLFFLGTFCERIIGKRRFIWFYLAAGLFAGIVSALMALFFGYGIGEKIFGSPTVAMLGASGALFGLVGLLAVLVPFKKVYLIAGPLIAIIVQAIIGIALPSSAVLNILDLAIMIYIFVAVISVFSINRHSTKIALPIETPFWLLPIIAIVPLFVIGLFVALPIGNIAHFSGLVAGLAYGWYLRIKFRKKVLVLQRYFE